MKITAFSTEALRAGMFCLCEVTIYEFLLDIFLLIYYYYLNLIHKSDDKEQVTDLRPKQKAAGLMRGAWETSANTSFSFAPKECFSRL